MSGGVNYVRRLLGPYVLISLILSGPLSISLLLKILYGRPAGITGLGHMWFLPCFFLSVFLFNIIFVAVQKEKFRVLIILLLGVVSAMLSYDANVFINMKDNVYHLTGWSTDSLQKKLYIGFPFSLNASLTGGVLIYMGVLVRRAFESMDLLKSKVKLSVTLVASLVVGVICFLLNQDCLSNDFPYHLITLAHAIYGNYLLFLLASVSLTVAILCISVFIDNKITSRIGSQTMAIYAFHPFVLSCIGSLMPFLPSARGLIPSAIALIVIYYIIPVIRKFDSTLLGERK